MATATRCYILLASSSREARRLVSQFVVATWLSGSVGLVLACLHWVWLEPEMSFYSFFIILIYRRLNILYLLASQLVTTS